MIYLFIYLYICENSFLTFQYSDFFRFEAFYANLEELPGHLLKFVASQYAYLTTLLCCEGV